MQAMDPWFAIVITVGTSVRVTDGVSLAVGRAHAERADEARTGRPA
jgi:hypothetical protein